MHLMFLLTTEHQEKPSSIGARPSAWRCESLASQTAGSPAALPAVLAGAWQCTVKSIGLTNRLPWHWYSLQQAAWNQLWNVAVVGGLSGCYWWNHGTHPGLRGQTAPLLRSLAPIRCMVPSSRVGGTDRSRTEAPSSRVDGIDLSSTETVLFLQYTSVPSSRVEGTDRSSIEVPSFRADGTEDPSSSTQDPPVGGPFLQGWGTKPLQYKRPFPHRDAQMSGVIMNVL